jgi:hypothetical protein
VAPHSKYVRERLHLQHQATSGSNTAVALPGQYGWGELCSLQRVAGMCRLHATLTSYTLGCMCSCTAVTCS